MPPLSRRNFIRNAALTTGLAAAARPRASAQTPPSDQVNVAVVGIHGRGRSHYRAYSRMPGVRVAYLVDIDERLFPEAIASIEQTAGYRPKMHYDLRKVLEDEEVDAVSIATPDHWHALHHLVMPSRQRRLRRKAGLVHRRRRQEDGRGRAQVRPYRPNRAQPPERPEDAGGDRACAIRPFGDVCRAKTAIYKGRASIGRAQEASIPEGVHWDLFLGPAPYRAFNINRFHYGWHFFWDTSTTDIGNTGVHSSTCSAREWASRRTP